MHIHLREYVNRLKNYSQKLNNEALLIDQPWLCKPENEGERRLLIFRKKNNELLITRNGIVQKGKWEYISSMNSLMIDYSNGESRLYNQGFFDESIMILKIDGTQEYEIFANEKKITSTLEKLLNEVERKYIEIATTQCNEKRSIDSLYRWGCTPQYIPSNGEVKVLDKGKTFIYSKELWSRMYPEEKEKLFVIKTDE